MMGPPSSMMGPVVSMGGHMGPSGPGGPMGPVSPMGPGPMMNMNAGHPPSEQPSPPSSGPKRKRKNGLKAGPPMGAGGAGPGPGVPPGSLMMGAVGGAMGPTSGPGAGLEDYEAFTEGIMAQLRTMPQVPLMEPVVKRSFNECPPFGGGPMNGELGLHSNCLEVILFEGLVLFEEIKY